MKISLLLSCYNRKEKTLGCLKAVSTQRNLDKNIHLNVVLVDDGSTDGTAETVKEKYPAVKLLKGNSQLFWNRGMLKAWEYACKSSPEFVIWLNDDTIIEPDAIATLLDTHKKLHTTTGKNGIVVGVTCNSKGSLSYGGMVRKSKWKMTTFSHLPVSPIPQPCLAMNGNCVLISKEVFDEIGLLDRHYQHAMGDIDYGLRATKAGRPIWTAPGYIGICDNDDSSAGSYRDPSLNLFTRYKKIISPKGLPPADWFLFCRRHAGFLWSLFWAWPYVNILFTSLSKQTDHKSINM